MEALEIIKLVAEIGFPIVAAGILLFFTWKMFHDNQDLLQKLVNNQITLQHPGKAEIQHLSAINAKIYSEMRSLLDTLHADRTYVVLYHNGGRSSSGLYFQKMSCICEVVSSGISPFSDSFQQIHRSSYMYMINRLESDQQVLIDDADTVKDMDNFLYTQIVARHVKSVYMQVLTDTEGDPVGFIGVDYCASNTDIPSEQIGKAIKVVGHKVSALVDVRDEVNQNS